MQPQSGTYPPSHVPHHLHVEGETCPWCEQDIPADKLADIKGRIAAKEQERTQAIAARLAGQYASALEQERRDSAAREARACEAARQLAEAEAGKRLATLQAELQQAADQKGAAKLQEQSLKQQLDELQQSKKSEIEQIKQAAEVQLQDATKEAHDAAEAAVRDMLTEKEREATEAKVKAEAAERVLTMARQEHSEALEQQRSVLEKAKDDAISQQSATGFSEKQKLLSQIINLQRDLEKKTNEELGEGAEVVLYDALREAFNGDRIERIKKGMPGADIRHVVISNGQECGTIIYDSKNHRKFLGEHVSKLVADQLAEKAEHAVLSLHKFPAKASQLHVQDGVVLVNPARVVALVTIIRQHLVQAHTLRLSHSERESKTAALYAFITSGRHVQLLDQIDRNAAALLDHQVSEMKWHQAQWERQGKLLRSTQKMKEDLCREVHSIIGAPPLDGLAAEDLSS